MQERKDFSWEQVTYAPLTHTFAILMILTIKQAEDEKDFRIGTGDHWL
jgi:hypothetical protein